MNFVTILTILLGANLLGWLLIKYKDFKKSKDKDSNKLGDLITVIDRSDPLDIKFRMGFRVIGSENSAYFAYYEKVMEFKEEGNNFVLIT